MRMGGKPVPFGIDEEILEAVLDRLLSSSWLDFRGIHLFAGTQILDYTLLLDQYRKGLEIARKVAGRLKRPLYTLDFGGGLGIPYFSNDQPLDMAGLRQGLIELMEESTSPESMTSRSREAGSSLSPMGACITTWPLRETSGRLSSETIQLLCCAGWTLSQQRPWTSPGLSVRRSMCWPDRCICQRRKWEI